MLMMLTWGGRERETMMMLTWGGERDTVMMLTWGGRGEGHVQDGRTWPCGVLTVISLTDVGSGCTAHQGGQSEGRVGNVTRFHWRQRHFRWNHTGIVVRAFLPSQSIGRISV